MEILGKESTLARIAALRATRCDATSTASSSTSTTPSSTPAVRSATRCPTSPAATCRTCPPERHAELVTVWRADVGGHYAAYTRGEVGYVEQRMTRANELHEQFGGPVLDDDAFARLGRVVRGRRSRTRGSAHPDVDAVLDKLLAAGLAVGALSNASVALPDHQARAGRPARPRADARRRRHPRLRQARPAGVRRGVPTAGHRRPSAPRTWATSSTSTPSAARAAGLVGIWVDRPGSAPAAADATRRSPAADVRRRSTSLDRAPRRRWASSCAAAPGSTPCGTARRSTRVRAGRGGWRRARRSRRAARPARRAAAGSGGCGSRRGCAGRRRAAAAAQWNVACSGSVNASPSSGSR